MKPLHPHPTALPGPAVARAGRPWGHGLPATAQGTARALALAALVALAGLLTACGPGVGGTGTGSNATPALGDFGAIAAPLCDSDVADALRCVPPPEPPGPAQTLPVWLSDADPAVRAVALVFANQVELQLRCDGLQFAGQWGRAEGDGGERFYGQAQRADGSLVRASLTLDLLPGGLLATLRAVDGTLLAAPVLLQDRAGPPAAAACT
jgi:hypothetical protein